MYVILFQFMILLLFHVYTYYIYSISIFSNICLTYDVLKKYTNSLKVYISVH